MKIIKKTSKVSAEKKTASASKPKKRQNMPTQKNTKNVASKKRVGVIEKFETQKTSIYAEQENELREENTYFPEICVCTNTVKTSLMAFASGADAVQVSFMLGAGVRFVDCLTQKDIHLLALLAHAEKRRLYVNLGIAEGVKIQEVCTALEFFVSVVNPHAFVLEDVALVPFIQQLGFTGKLCASPTLQYHTATTLQQAHFLGLHQIYLPSAITATELATLHQAVAQPITEGGEGAESSATPLNLTTPATPHTPTNFTLHIHGDMHFCAEGTYLGAVEKSWGGEGGDDGRAHTDADFGQQEYKVGGRSGLFFACLDLALEAAVRPLQTYEHITTWLIKAHNRTPHYVDHVVRAYLLLRDHGKESGARKEAEQLFSFALGRQGVKAGFASETGGTHKNSPLALAHGNTALMGRYCGKVAGALRSFTLTPTVDLLAGDVLRMGEKTDRENTLVTIQTNVLACNETALRFAGGRYPKIGTPVFLVNREESPAQKNLALWQKKWAGCGAVPLQKNKEGTEKSQFDFTHNVFGIPALGKRSVSTQGVSKKKPSITHIGVSTSLPVGKGPMAFGSEKGGRGTQSLEKSKTLALEKNGQSLQGLWLGKKAIEGISKTLIPRISWWLPPLMWPEEERFWLRLIREAQQKGARYFVCNNFAQLALFKQNIRGNEIKKLMLSAGPFCHITTPFAVHMAEKLGCSTLFVSPSLSFTQMCALAPYATVKLGAVDGYIPLCLSRYTPATGKIPLIFEKSYEQSLWARRYSGTTWVYSDVALTFGGHEKKLQEAGYTVFAHLHEHLPYELVKKAKAETERDAAEQKIQKRKDLQQEKMNARKNGSKAKLNKETREDIHKKTPKNATTEINKDMAKGSGNKGRVKENSKDKTKRKGPENKLTARAQGKK